MSPASDTSEQQLEKQLSEVVRQYYTSEFGDESRVDLGMDFYRENLLKDAYTETVKREVGGEDIYVYRAHVLVELDSKARGELNAVWRAQQVDRRLAMAGGGAAAVFFLLGTLFAYLKLDTMTRGYYTTRLKLAAAAVILSMALAVWWAAQAHVVL